MRFTGERDAARAVQGEDERWLDAFHRGDADALAEIYSHDVVVLPPDAPPFEGHDAVRRWMREFFAGHEDRQRLVNDEVHAEGRLAILRGAFELEIRPRGGARPRRLRRKHLVVWRLDDGDRGRAWRDIWNVSPGDGAPGQ